VGRFVHHFVGSVGFCIARCRATLAADELGLVLRTQRSGDILVTRPFFTSRECGASVLIRRIILSSRQL